MAKVIVQHVCSECGTATGRWLGKCPGCGAFGSLVEEMTGQATPAKGRGGVARTPERLADVRAEEAARIGTGVPELDRVLGGGLVPASLVLVGGEPGVGKSTLLLAALGNVARAGRRALLVTGEESVAQVKLRADRLGGAEQVEILAETELESVCATLEQERPDVCVIDSIQTLYSAELGSAPGSVGAGAGGGRAAPPRRQGAGRGDDPRRPRDQGRLGGRAARARASRRLRPPVRGRPLPRPPDSARGEEPLRLDERARRVRDDERRARRRSRIPRSCSGGRHAGEVGAAVACALEGTRPILLEIQSLVSRTDLAMPRRVGTGVDPKRLAMIVAVLSRHAGIALGSADVFVNVAGGVRIDEPGRRPRRRARDRVCGPGRPGQGRRRGVRRDRAHRPPAAGRAGRTSARGVREARCRDGHRPRRNGESWRAEGHAGRDAAAGDRSGARRIGAAPDPS